MKKAADRGHSKAQFEHGLGVFSVRYQNIPLFHGKVLLSDADRCLYVHIFVEFELTEITDL